MAMVSMKMDKEEAKELTQPEPGNTPEYPYGLELHLDDKALAKLGLSQPPAVGTQLTVSARITVTSASSYQTQGGEAEASSCWQITDMEVGSGASSSADAAAKLYPASA